MVGLPVHFCEEYPSDLTLAPASLIPAPAVVFIAAGDFSSFEAARERLATINGLLEAGWWLYTTESYAPSVFSRQDELEHLTSELGKAPPGLKVLLDLEAPLWKPRLLRKSLRGILDTRRRLDRLIEVSLANHEVWTAEYPPALPAFLVHALRLGLASAQTRVYMLYGTETGGWWGRYLKRRTRARLRSSRGAIAIGTIAPGVTGNPRRRSPDQLRCDLREAESLGACAVMVYRLGGLTSEYVAAIGLGS